jgi:hypothetical protein
LRPVRTFVEHSQTVAAAVERSASEAYGWPMLADTFWFADGLMLVSVAVMLVIERVRTRRSRAAARSAAGVSDAELAALERRTAAIFQRWAGAGAQLVEEPAGRWTALVPVRPGGPALPLALHAPTRRPDLALLSALRLMAVEAPREITRVDEIYDDWCVHHNGTEWNVHIPCRSCVHTRVPLPYTDLKLVDVARLLARQLHRRHGPRGTCPSCASGGAEPDTVSAVAA